MSNITEKEILEVYNLDFLDNIAIWIKTAEANKKGILLQAIQSLLINMIKVSNDLKYHPFHL